MRVMDRLGSLQFDPIDAAGRNHDLTLLSRVAGYRRAWTDDLLYRDRVLYETYNKMLSIVPTAELPWYRLTWDRSRGGARRRRVRRARALVDELLERIRDARARWPRRTSSRARPSTGTGARPTRSGRSSRRSRGRDPRHLAARGQQARLRPHRAPVPGGPAGAAPARARAAAPQAAVAVPRQRAARRDRRVHARGPGSARRRTGRRCAEELVDAGEIVPVEVEGFRRAAVRRRGRGADPRRGRGRRSRPGSRCADPGVAFLAALDPLAWDRDLLLRLFGLRLQAGRSTSPGRSAAGATTRCRSCTATGSSAGWTRRSTARPGTLRDPRPVVGGRVRPAVRGEPGVRRTRSPTRCARTWRSSTRGRSRCRAWHGIASSRRRSGPACRGACGRAVR